MSYNQLLNKTLEVVRKLSASDGMGGFTDGTDEEWISVKGRISPASAQTQTMYQALGVRVTHTVYLQAGVQVAEGNQLRYGTRYLLVKGIKDPDESGHHLELQCEEVR